MFLIGDDPSDSRARGAAPPQLRSLSSRVVKISRGQRMSFRTSRGRVGGSVGDRLTDGRPSLVSTTNSMTASSNPPDRVYETVPALVSAVTLCAVASARLRRLRPEIR